jgi:perosamine synthetase
LNIPVNTPLLDGNEKKYLSQCIDSGWISSEGPFVKEFETQLSKTVSRKYGIAVSSGTAAIDIAVEALGLSEGDEIIMPTFTIISCLHQVIRSGCTPVFIDSDLETWNMDVSEIESKITYKTKAIMVVHIYGLPIDIDPVLKIAQRYNLKVIEDAAEMFGQEYKGRPCGSFGDISIFSFYPNKHITTGEGGMVVTDDEQLAYKCRSLRNLCFQKDNRFVHLNLGWNYRMTNLQAAVGVAQLERLAEFIQIKRKMGKLYTQLLTGLPNIRLPLLSTNYAKNIYWVYGIMIDKNFKKDAKDLMLALAEYGIGSRPFFYPLHLQPVLKNKITKKFPKYENAELLFQKGLYIPSGLALKEDEIKYVAEKLKYIIESWS